MKRRHQHPHYDKNKMEGLASTYKSFIDGINAVVGLIALPIFGNNNNYYYYNYYKKMCQNY